jgi:protein-S-isoprenylcysteine O-methyltransferase Ste14
MHQLIGPISAVRSLWGAWLVSWLVAAAWRDRAVKHAGFDREFGFRALVIAGAWLVFGADVRGAPDAVAWTMVGVVACGLAATWWARLYLGTLWSSDITVKQGHRVVDTGPYGIVRHPIYSGVILATFGTAALVATPRAALGAALMTVGFFVKARIEEAFLREQLGAAAYDSYARRVPMLVPFL